VIDAIFDNLLRLPTAVLLTLAVGGLIAASVSFSMITVCGTEKIAEAYFRRRTYPDHPGPDDKPATDEPSTGRHAHIGANPGLPPAGRRNVLIADAYRPDPVPPAPGAPDPSVVEDLARQAMGQLRHTAEFFPPVGEPSWSPDSAPAVEPLPHREPGAALHEATADSRAVTSADEQHRPVRPSEEFAPPEAPVPDWALRFGAQPPTGLVDGVRKTVASR